MIDLFNEAEQPLPGEPFSGVEPGYLETAAKGVMRGGVKAVRGGLLAGSALFPAETEERDASRIIPRQEDFFRFNDDYLDPAEKYWQVDTTTMGNAQKIVHGLAELPLQLIGGGSTAALTMAMNTGKEMVEQGVDGGTAALIGAGAGATMGAMIAMPQAGTTIKQTLALIASNPVLGAGQDYATKKMLEAKGYEGQAANIDPFDIPARSIDLLLGGIFGGVAHYGRWRQSAPTAVVDAIDTVEVTRQRENLNPFEPGTVAAKNHAATLESALDSLTNGRPVDTSQHLVKPVEQVEPVRFGEVELRARALENGMEPAAADNILTQLDARASAMGLPVDAFVERYAAAESEALPSAARIIAASLDSHERKQLDTWLFSQVPGARWNDSHLQQLDKALADFMSGAEMKQSVRSTLARIIDPLPIKTEAPPEVLAIRNELETVRTEFEQELAAYDVQPDPPPAPRIRSIAQDAASERISAAARKVDTQNDSIITAIAKLGGLDKAEAETQWGNLVRDGRKGLNDHVLQQTRRFGAVFKKEGMALDKMREAMIERGYLPEGASIKELEAAIDDATRGTFRPSMEKQLGDADLAAMEAEYYQGYESAADQLLTEAGDFEMNDGTNPDGSDRKRSAREMLDEARGEVAAHQQQEALYQRAAVCLNLG